MKRDMTGYLLLSGTVRGNIFTSIKTFVMHLQCASAPQYFNHVPDDRAVQGSSSSSEIFSFFFVRPLFSWRFVFLLISNLIFYSMVRDPTKFKTHRSLSD